MARQFNNLLLIVLMVAAVVTTAIGHWIDGGIIAAVVVLNALIGFVQEGKAERALQAIRHLLSPHAVVLRDGRQHDIDAANLVPGDIVLLASGDSIPAVRNMAGVSGVSVRLHPATRADAHSAAAAAPGEEEGSSAERAACAAMSDDEQAVSTVTAGPRRPNT